MNFIRIGSCGQHRVGFNPPKGNRIPERIRRENLDQRFGMKTAYRAIVDVFRKLGRTESLKIAKGFFEEFQETHSDQRTG